MSQNRTAVFDISEGDNVEQQVENLEKLQRDREAGQQSTEGL